MNFENNPLIGNIYEIVIKTDTNDGRFESFACGVVSQLEGNGSILTTRPKWDLGRDGVGFGASKGIFVCASLRDDVDAKALSDMSRLEDKTCGIKKVYFCSSQLLTEHARNKITSALIQEYGSTYEYEVLGAHQLRELSLRDPDLIKTKYAAEIANCKAAIEPEDDDSAETAGLRLALMTSGAENSLEIRSSIYAAAILDSLNESKKTIRAICNSISQRLRLPGTLDEKTLAPYLGPMAAEGLIELHRHDRDKSKDTYAITQSGIDRLTERETSAAQSLMEGRSKIQVALETAIGMKMLPDAFASIWNVFEEKLAYALYVRGASVVAEISALIEPNSSSGNDVIEPLSFVEDIAEAVSAVAGHQQRQAEIQQAIKDLFSNRVGPAADWLVQVCAGFIAACTMGLEHKSANAIGKLLARTTIVLDSDVVLSLLGEGEPDHEAVQTIVKHWKKNKGTILVAEPVLQELAHHAWIADNDYHEVKHFLPGTPQDRLNSVDNVFVRSFAELLSRNGIRRDGWRSYYLHFAGKNKDDYSSIQQTLSADYSILRLPGRSSVQGDLAQQVYKYSLDLFEKSQLRVTKIMRDKAARDSELYTAFVNYVNSVREADPGASCLLVSSGRRLSQVEDHFKETGERQMIISVQSTLLLVSLLPNLALGLSQMKAFLFDEHRHRFTTGFERKLIRIVRSSRELEMPWAKRGILMRNVRDRLLTNAKQEGRPRAEQNMDALERDALREDNRDLTVQMLRDSLDALAIDTRQDKQIRELKRENERLEEEIKKLRKVRGKK
ncbi:hypothetical protein [Xanthomonas sp. 3307]|uniref:hypothetical protein n=1 Tax=Xanthomonas sp. 3307 TaxID=3035316 RepID=UPI0016094A47|nr:hypothetical protein [Xanthomonas sp. 3307]MBB5944384.1 DNA-binding PadR family transcriptional regulator [Xanthomonas sp. 3307]